MYAVIKTGGKQYRIAAGDKVKVEKLGADVGTEILLDQVLMVGEGDTVALGLRRFEPFVEDPMIQSVRKKKPAESPPGGSAEPRGN